MKRGDKVPSHLTNNLLVGVGWHAEHCFQCKECTKGLFRSCQTTGFNGTGITRNGGYAQYATANWEATVVVPEGWANKPEKAAPLLCAGLTVFNALRNSEILPGEVVVIQGIGGLGHLAVQYASRLGYYTVAVTSSPNKHQEAIGLGAKEALTATEDGSHVKRIKELGGAKVVIATAPHSKSISDIVPALSFDGSLILVAAPHEPISINAINLIISRSKIVGWPSGAPSDSEETLNASHLIGVEPLVETFPLSKANEAYKAMAQNKVRFRSVILPNA